MSNKKTYIIDIDDTISFSKYIEETDSYDYENARPDLKVINKIQNLNKEGHSIILHTSRGMRKFKGDAIQASNFHREFLTNWLEINKVPYDEIIFGKPWGNNVFYVDDRSLTISQFVSNEEHSKFLEFNQKR